MKLHCAGPAAAKDVRLVFGLGHDEMYNTYGYDFGIHLA